MPEVSEQRPPRIQWTTRDEKDSWLDVFATTLDSAILAVLDRRPNERLWGDGALSDAQGAVEFAAAVADAAVKEAAFHGWHPPADRPDRRRRRARR